MTDCNGPPVGVVGDVTGTTAVWRTVGTGFRVQPLAHDLVVGENASTFTFVPADREFFVDSTTSCTALSGFVPERATARLTARGAYWSSVRTRLPLTSTATLPFDGPATNHIAKRGPRTANVADAPVSEAVWKARP